MIQGDMTHGRSLKKILQNLLADGSKRISRAPKILLFINLPQDLDMLLPLAMRLQKKSDYQVEVAVTDKAWQQSLRIGNLLSAAGIQASVVSHKSVVAGLQPPLAGIRALVTASESTANAHKGPYVLTQRANRQGISTYTMQHGFENVGLTYFDAEYPVGAILFASQTLFTWVAIAQLPAETPAETKQKCVAVGCPKFVGCPEFMDAPAAHKALRSRLQIPRHTAENRLIIVFENLHWSRYRDHYRQRFLQDLEQTAWACPEVTFLIKPHHTGAWLSQRYQGKLPAASNLVIADPKAPEWEAFTAPALIEMADAVITTPSTVAIDAVRAGCPVAVVAYDLNLPNFEPLPLLRSEADWRGFCVHPDYDLLLKPLKAFAQQRLLPGDAVQKIVDCLAQDLMKSTLSNRHTDHRVKVRERVREIVYTPESRIRSPRQLFSEMAQDLWLSRTLAWRLFVRDIQSQYRSSFLGTLWAVVPAAMTAAGLTFASRSGVINVGETDIPYPVFVMLGTVLWQTFLDAFNGPEAAIKASRAVLSQVKFPYEAIILAQMGQVLFNLLLKLALLAVLFVVFSVTVSWKLIFAPFALWVLILLGTGMGLFLVPINYLVQDISRAMAVILLVWFFLTPVIYPVPDQAAIATLVRLNPVTPLLVTARELMTTGIVSEPVGFVVVSGLAIASLCFGWLVFRLSIPFLVERIS